MRGFNRFVLSLYGVILCAACTLDFDEFKANADPDDARVMLGDDGLPDVEDSGSVIPPDFRVQDMGILDGDGDGVSDDIDNCPETPNQDQSDLDADAVGDVCDEDDDGDDRPDEQDNCPLQPNSDQADIDADGVGDVCDEDADGDGLNTGEEMERGTHPLRPDSDGDGLSDLDDLCPLMPDATNWNSDDDDLGDVCDHDDDNDGVLDWWDNCHLTPNPDQAPLDPNDAILDLGAACADDYDEDGVADALDLCRYMPGEGENQPCVPLFDVRGYVRDIRDVENDLNSNMVVAATAGGMVTVSRLPNGEHFAAHQILQRGLNTYDIRRVFVGQPDWYVLTHEGVSIVDFQTGRTFNIPRRELPSGEESTLTDLVAVGNHLWVASDRGVNRLTEDGWGVVPEGQLPSTDVRALLLDELDRVWVVTPVGAVRYVAGVIDGSLSALPEVGDLTGIHQAEENSVWITGSEGAVLVGADGMILAHHTDLTLTDISQGESAYGVSPDGLVRLDESYRPYPAGRAPLPDGLIRTISEGFLGTANVWVGTIAGLYEVDGLFSTFSAEPHQQCITISRRFEGALWIGTANGVYRQDAQGRFASLDQTNLPGYDEDTQQGPAVHMIERARNEIWVGTGEGIGRFTPQGEPLGQIVNELIPPQSEGPVHVVDIEQDMPNRVWIATQSHGLVEYNFADGERWNHWRVAGSPRLLSDQINGLADAEGRLWIATPEGIARFDAEDNDFLLPVQGQGFLVSDNVLDIEAGGGNIFAITDRGLSVRQAGQWYDIWRSSDRVPEEAGTDSVHSVLYRDGFLWVAMQSSRLKPYGSLIRRPADATFTGPFEIYANDAIGLPLSESPERVRLNRSGDEIMVSTCGNQESPGGLSVSRTSQIMPVDRLSTVARGTLRGDGHQSTLTTGWNDLPIVVGMEGDVPVADVLLPNAIESMDMTDEFGVPPTDCDVPPEGEGENVWCIFGDLGFAKLEANERWSAYDIDTLPTGMGGGPLQLRRVIAVNDRTWWAATDAGVLRLQGASTVVKNVANSDDSLPSNDVRDILLADRHLYIGTARGVAVLSIDENEWKTLGGDPLPAISVRSLALSGDGHLWIGTDSGLYKRPIEEGESRRFTLQNGLNSPQIDDVIVLPTDGRVFVATDSGIAWSDGLSDFVPLGIAQGLPGMRAHRILWVPSGHLWIQSDAGVARLNVQE